MRGAHNLPDFDDALLACTNVREPLMNDKRAVSSNRLERGDYVCQI